MLEQSLSMLRRDRARQAAELAVAERARAKLQAEVDALRAQRDGADAELAEATGALQSTAMDMEDLKVRVAPVPRCAPACYTMQPAAAAARPTPHPLHVHLICRLLGCICSDRSAPAAHLALRPSPAPALCRPP